MVSIFYIVDKCNHQVVFFYASSPTIPRKPISWCERGVNYTITSVEYRGGHEQLVMIKRMNDFLCEIQTGNVEEDKEETKRKIGIIK